MKAIFIAYDQAHRDRIVEMLDRLNCRGFTAWEQVTGRGSVDGEPHYGSHAWPSLAGAIVTMVEDHRVQPVLEKLRQFNDERPKLGLRAVVWHIENVL
ncbi:MAG: hypothetical protein K2F99_05890 [Muribaculaceae bacterium]|nr:hypothetical protein [Muribaculaceae bacterium]